MDVEVHFSKDMTVETWSITASTDAEVAALLCDTTEVQDANLQNVIDYVQNGATSLDNIVGITFGGALLYNPVQAGSVSAFYPSTGSDLDVDACFGYVDSDGILGYIGMDVCMANIDTVTNSGVDGVVMCDAWTDCNTDKELYVQAAVEASSSYNKKTPVGMAKDGHVIYGPMQSSSKRWCDAPDVCNGFTGSDDTYSYLISSYAPFGVACWGPGAVEENTSS
jgi:hypothetical protein